MQGVAEEPLAENHVVMTCQARKKAEHRFTVPNVFGAEKAAVYAVLSDLTCVSGDAQCRVEAGKSGAFNLCVLAPTGGVTRGSLTFTAPGGQYVWFTLELHASPPPHEAGGGYRKQALDRR